jgi:hypothetical protein
MPIIKPKCTGQNAKIKMDRAGRNNKRNHYFQISCLLMTVFFFIACAEKKPIDESALTKTPREAADCEGMRREALRMDSVLMQETELNEAKANAGIKAFADFANFCPTDSLSPVFLIKCAQVARAVNAVPQAKVVLEKCIADYPQFRDRAAALFLLAQLYDEVIYLNNEEEAKRLYEQILSEYPTSDWAYSAKGALSFIGKSDEEILRTFKSKKK